VFHPTTAGEIFISKSCGALTKIEYTFGHNACPKKCNCSEILKIYMQYMMEQT
jgi:hypothetical protein